MKRQLLKYCASTLAIALAATPVLAQDAAVPQAADTERGLGDIVVTARKVAERLQDVPIAVTVYNEAALKERNAVKLEDLSAVTPSLTLSTASTSGSSYTRISIRGQVATDTVSTSDLSVGVYVDGVYWARSQGINSNLLDVGSVQVLKGPQGTLFGRNTTGGAIVITSNEPNLNDFSGRVLMEYGTYDYKRGEGVINVPLIEGKLGLRAAFQVADGGGYITNDIGPKGKKLGAVGTTQGKLRLKWQATDDFSVLLSADIFRDKPDNYLGVANYINPALPASAGLEQIGIETIGAAACLANRAACAAAGSAAFYAYANQYSRPGFDHVQYNFDPEETTKTETYGITLSYDSAIGNLKFVGGHRRMAHDFAADYDGGPWRIYSFTSHQRQNSTSGELTLTGRTFSDRLSYAAGLFYFKETGEDSSRVLVNVDQQILFNTGALAGISRGSRFFGDLDNKSIGAYAQASFKITEELSFTGGLRWSQDKKGVTIANGQTTLTNVFQPGAFQCTVQVPGAATGVVLCPQVRKGKFDGVNYLAGLDYKITPDVLIFAKVSTAFRAGGVNLRETTQIPGVPTVPFQPEKSTSYEAGIKSEFWDRRIRLNIAGFYNEMKNLQRSFIFSAVTPGTTTVSSTTVIGNAPKATFYGGEAELTAKLFDNGTDSYVFSGNLSYTKPKYNNYIVGGATPIDKRNEFFPYSPKWQFTVGGLYKHEFDRAILSASASYTWDSGYHTTQNNFYTDSAGVVRNASTGGALTPAALADLKQQINIFTKQSGGTLNGRIGLDFGGKYEIALLGKNLLDNRSRVAGTYFANTTGAIIRARPREVSIQGTVKF